LKITVSLIIKSTLHTIARSCVLKSLDGGQLYAGNPARPLKEKQKRDAVFTRLELLEKRLKK